MHNNILVLHGTPRSAINMEPKEYTNSVPINDHAKVYLGENF